MRNTDVGEYVQVGAPADDGARPGVLFVQRFLGQFTDDLALAEGDAPLDLPAVGCDLHVFGGILRCAGAQTVQSQRVLVCGTVAVVVVFSAGVQLTVDEIPVPASLAFVPAQRHAAPAVVHLDTQIAEVRDLYDRSVSLTRFVHGVGQDFKEGMFAPLQPVRAEYDARTLADAVCALERRDALIAVSVRLGGCRSCRLFILLGSRFSRSCFFFGYTYTGLLGHGFLLPSLILCVYMYSPGLRVHDSISLYHTRRENARLFCGAWMFGKHASRSKCIYFANLLEISLDLPPILWYNTDCSRRNDGTGRRAGLKIYFAVSYHLGVNP